MGVILSLEIKVIGGLLRYLGLHGPLPQQLNWSLIFWSLQRFRKAVAWQASLRTGGAIASPPQFIS
jgi:hypothetical protein